VLTRSTGTPEVPLLRPMLVDSAVASARVSLVPEGAMLLAGDRISLEVEVGPGARLELVEPAGTVAYDMRGRDASWDVRVVLREDAVLVWHGEPFVAAAGSRTRRRTDVTLAPGAVLALRETLVLGRYGEPPGEVSQQLTATGSDGRPLLVEELVLGSHRVVGSVLLLGAVVPPDEAVADRFELERGGTLWRRLGREAHLATPADAWTAAVRSCARSAAAPGTPGRAPRPGRRPG
jgi:urease accessory protein